MSTEQQIYDLLVGQKVFDGTQWHVYDETGAELSAGPVLWRAVPGALIMWPRAPVDERRPRLNLQRIAGAKTYMRGARAFTHVHALRGSPTVELPLLPVLPQPAGTSAVGARATTTKHRLRPRAGALVATTHVTHTTEVSLVSARGATGCDAVGGGHGSAAALLPHASGARTGITGATHFSVVHTSHDRKNLS